MPVHWKLLTEEEAGRTWNTNAGRFEDSSPFQAFEWGRYQQALGWTPIHYAPVSDDSEVKAMCLALLWRGGFVWCVGGPIGEIAMWSDLRPAPRRT